MSDIEARIDNLREIEKRFPNHILVSNGDLIDRNEKVKEAIDFFINSNHIALMGNHEYMMRDFLMGLNIYSYDDWLRNGGIHTVKSFINDKKESFIFENLANILIDNCNSYHLKLKAYSSELNALKNQQILTLKKDISSDFSRLRKIALKYITKPYLDFLDNLSWFFETDTIFVSHCPIPKSLSIKCFKEKCIKRDISVLENRFVSDKPKEKLMIFGHNSQMDVKRYFYKNKLYAINLDTSKSKNISFYNTETKEISLLKVLD